MFLKKTEDVTNIKKGHFLIKAIKTKVIHDPTEKCANHAAMRRAQLLTVDGI